MHIGIHVVMNPRNVSATALRSVLRKYMLDYSQTRCAAACSLLVAIFRVIAAAKALTLRITVGDALADQDDLLHCPLSDSTVTLEAPRQA